MKTRNTSFIRTSRRSGVTLIYGVAIMTAMCAFCSLAVDYGHVQLVKEQLRRAADASARAGAGGLELSAASARSTAVYIASQNSADGASVVINPASDIELGLWTNNTFTVLPDSDSRVNAVHVTCRHTAARANAVPLLFGEVLGASHCDVSADSIAMLIPPLNLNQTVLATANPFLAAAQKGATASEVNPHHDPDHAGDSNNELQSPTTVGLPVNGGTAFTFDSIGGTARHDPNLPYYEPDGETDNVGHNNLTTSEQSEYGSTMYSQNGISDMWCPINALVGVFVSDAAPDPKNTPDSLDFSTDDKRNFQTLSPKLNQLFFIGDGQMDDGTAQSFIAPTGATRLYLATWDFYEWSNNAGSRVVKVSRPGQIITVR